MRQTRRNACSSRCRPSRWIALFLFAAILYPFLLQFLELLAQFQQIVHHAYAGELSFISSQAPLYLTRNSSFAAHRLLSVAILSLLLGYPLAFFLPFMREASPPALSGGHHSAVGQLPGARVCVEGDLRPRGSAEYIATLAASRQHPLGFLLYSPLAVIVTLTHIYMPFVVLPVVASLEKIPRELLESSSDLGARPLADLPARDPAAIAARSDLRRDLGLFAQLRRLPLAAAGWAVRAAS